MGKNKSGIKPPFRKIYDSQNNVVGGVSKNSICDPNGASIATLSGVDAVTGENGKQSKVKVYESEMGEFRVSKGTVTLNGAAFGGVSNAWIIPLALLSAFVFIVGVSVAALLVIRPWVPSSKTPVIDIGDENGPWTETVDMLPSSIYPGSGDVHEFVLTNPHDDPMIYRFDIKELYNDEEVKDFPIKFRMLQDGEPITDYWYTSEELEQFRFTVHKGDTYNCGIEWRWEFDSGNDERDTIYGKENGTYSLDITITNEAVIY